MAPPDPVAVPKQVRRAAPARDAVDAVEQEVARTAGLVLRLTALADRYAGRADSDERVALMRATAALGRRALLDLAAEPLAARPA